MFLNTKEGWKCWWPRSYKDTVSDWIQALTVNKLQYISRHKSGGAKHVFWNNKILTVYMWKREYTLNTKCMSTVPAVFEILLMLRLFNSASKLFNK